MRRYSIPLEWVWRMNKIHWRKFGGTEVLRGFDVSQYKRRKGTRRGWTQRINILFKINFFQSTLTRSKKDIFTFSIKISSTPRQETYLTGQFQDLACKGLKLVWRASNLLKYWEEPAGCQRENSDITPRSLEEKTHKQQVQKMEKFNLKRGSKIFIKRQDNVEIEQNKNQ